MGLDNLCAWKKGLIFGMIVTLIFIAIEIAENTVFSISLIIAHILYFIAPSIVFFIIGSKILNRTWSSWIKGLVIGVEVYLVTLIFSIPAAFLECSSSSAGDWCGILPFLFGIYLLLLIPLGLIIGIIYQIFNKNKSL